MTPVAGSCAHNGAETQVEASRTTFDALLIALAIALCSLFPAAAAAAAAEFAPVDQPGPPLSRPGATLGQALQCSGGLEGASRAPVLLVHGTSITREENWSATYMPALSSLGIPWCAVELPQRATGDIQSHVEYVVHAIREMHLRSGRRIAIIGASQGGMLPRWVFRFWPDTRAMVDDLVALAPSNHGTTQAELPCRSGCRPAIWQQKDEARFIRALNSFRETFAGISYTNVYTRYDEVVKPPESSALHTGDGRITNVRVQDICQFDFSDHITLALANAAGFALAMDALRRDGPADFAAVRVRGCSQPSIPGYNPARLAAMTAQYFNNRDTGAATVRSEPSLRCYVVGTCPPGAAVAPRLGVAVSPRRVLRGRRTRLRVRVRARMAGRLRAVRRATVSVGGRRRRTDKRGRATLVVRLTRPGRRRVTASADGYATGRTSIRVVSRSRRR